MPSKKTAPAAVDYRPEEDLSAEELRELPRVATVLEQAPGRRMISLRLREDVLQRLKQVARRKAVPYQVLVQLWLLERLELEDSAQQPEEAVVKLRHITSELQQIVHGMEGAGKRTAPRRGSRGQRTGR
jgi:predicted DNA binding CopG/RHH family protein